MGRRESFAERRERRAAVDDPETVLEAAARFLEARSRSISEVRRRLTGAGYRPELVEGAIERLTELGMLDDEVFARAWVESRDRARPRGERAIREELRLKGVDRAVIEAVLEARREAALARGQAPGRAGDGHVPEGTTAGSADRVAAERLLARHERALARVPDARVRRQRAYALLARNGFDPDICREVAATAAAAEGPVSPDDAEDVGS